MLRSFNRLRRGLRAGLEAARSSPDMDMLSQQIDDLKETKQLPTSGEIEGDIEEKTRRRRRGRRSKLKVRSTSQDLAVPSVYSFIHRIAQDYEEIDHYDWDDPYVDFHLAEVWQRETILSGAVYSMEAKMTAIKWSVTGRKSLANEAAQMLARAAHMGGEDWGGFIGATAQDFYTTNRGVFWETGRRGKFGRTEDVGHIDALSCTLTGNTKRPVWYYSETTGQNIRFRPWEVIQFASLPSARERRLGTGFCAVARAIRAAKLLLALYKYDEEKLANLPPEGVATLTGLTLEEFNDAVTLWKVKREQDDSLTFPQVLWLLGSQPNAKVGLELHAFSQLPESFDRSTVVAQYVNTLALVFGVDAREFWPISTGALGTAAESEIQHLKAKGKGPGEFISQTERYLNGELPSGIHFAYDTQDIEEDLTAAQTAQAWISAYLPLAQPFGGIAGGATPMMVGGQNQKQDEAEEQETENTQLPPQSPASATQQPEGLISKDDLLRLLADKGVIPDYLVPDQRRMVEDSDVHIKHSTSHLDDIVRYEWDKSGVLKQVRLPAMYLRSHTPPATNGNVPDAKVLTEKQKAEEHERKIRGKPISEREVDRGANVTDTALQDELELWRNNPELSPYAPTEDEAERISVS